MERNATSNSILEWVTLTKRPPCPNGNAPTLTVVDLFCGCGGMTLGARQAARHSNRRLDVRLAIDLAPEPLAVFRDNFDCDGWRVRRDDVAEVFAGRLGADRCSRERYWAGRVGRLDLLVAGPPCQGHSDLNNSTRRKDPRNGLYLHVVRAAEALRPKAVIIENVPAVVHDRKGVVRQAIARLEAAEYHVTVGLVQIASLGVPQQRKRHVLVATKSRRFELTTLPGNANGAPTVGQFLAGLEDEPEQRPGVFFQPSQMTSANRRRVKYLFKNGDHDLPDGLRPACHRDKSHSYVSMYGRMYWDRPAQTITTGFGSMGQGRFVHPTRPRTLTAHEAARLQGFPDFFDFSSAGGITALREMIGNAVPPPLCAAVVGELLASGAV